MKNSVIGECLTKSTFLFCHDVDLKVKIFSWNQHDFFKNLKISSNQNLGQNCTILFWCLTQKRMTYIVFTCASTLSYCLNVPGLITAIPRRTSFFLMPLNEKKLRNKYNIIKYKLKESKKISSNHLLIKFPFDLQLLHVQGFCGTSQCLQMVNKHDLQFWFSNF